MTLLGKELTVSHLVIFFIFLHFALWLLYFALFRKSRWAFFAWFPFTASCGISLVYWLLTFLQAMGERGQGEASGWFMYGVLVASPLAVLTAVLFVIALKSRPKPCVNGARVAITTLAFYFTCLGCIVTPAIISYKQSLYSIRLHFEDENGLPLSGVAVCIFHGNQVQQVNSDAQGIAIIQGTRPEGIGGQFSSDYLKPRRKLINFGYVFLDTPNPHIHLSYDIDETTPNGARRPYRSVSADYPYQDKITDITVVLEKVGSPE